MINKILLFCFFLIYNCIYAQFGEAQLIEDVDFQISKVYASDLDGDGDMDVLASGANADTIIWYENLDGLGNFGTKQYITQTLNFTQSLSTADLDGDGDQDVIANSKTQTLYDHLVVWYENLDGLGNFSAQKIIVDMSPYDLDQAVATDIDGDNDLDVVVAVSDLAKVVWLENLDGLGNFSTEKIVSNNTIGVYQVTVADVDGDGFTDILCNSSSVSDPSWFKNLDGQGAFGTENIIDDLGTMQIETADIDGDGDIDVFKIESVDSFVTLHWLENTDGLGNFVQRQLISDAFQARNVFATDIDNDGDIDLFATYVGDGKIAWFENEDGLGTFGERKIIDDFASTTIFGVDLDGDGYKDALTNHELLGLVWYKNLTYLGVEESLQNKIQLYPNPVQNILHLQVYNATINQVIIYDILGEKVLEFANVINNQVNVSKLNTGMYFVHINTSEGVLVKKVVKN